MAAGYNNNLGDVANLRDLDYFNVDSVHQSLVHSAPILLFFIFGGCGKFCCNPDK